MLKFCVFESSLVCLGPVLGVGWCVSCFCLCFMSARLPPKRAPSLLFFMFFFYFPLFVSWGLFFVLFFPRIVFPYGFVIFWFFFPLVNFTSISGPAFLQAPAAKGKQGKNTESKHDSLQGLEV